MNKEGVLKAAIIAGLIVAIISIFILTPLSEIIFKKDSFIKIIEKTDNSPSTEKTNQTKISDNENNTDGVNSINSNKEVRTRTKSEDFSSYINKSFTNSTDKKNIEVFVVDESGDLLTSLSTSFANIYNKAGYEGSIGLLRTSFIYNSNFQKLFDGNSEIIDKMNLSNYTDYIAIGKIRFNKTKGTLVDGTFICRAFITMNIISTNQKKLTKSFSFSENGNGVSEAQAENEALQKLILKYSSEYSSIQ